MFQSNKLSHIARLSVLLLKPRISKEEKIGKSLSDINRIIPFPNIAEDNISSIKMLALQVVDKESFLNLLENIIEITAESESHDAANALSLIIADWDNIKIEQLLASALDWSIDNRFEINSPRFTSPWCLLTEYLLANIPK